MTSEIKNAEIQSAPTSFEYIKEAADPTAKVETSVIIPAYNRVQELPRALASLVHQRYLPSEVIIVDDRSTDRTVEVACAFEAPFDIVVVQHNNNAGASAARNTGMAIARGRLIAFLDSDDEWHPQRLEIQMAEMRNVGSNDLVLLSRVIVRSSHMADTIEPSHAKAPDVSTADFLFRQRGIIQLGTMLMPGHFRHNVKFEEGQQINEDWEFCISLEEQGAIIHMMDEPLLIWYDETREGRLSLSAPPGDLLTWLNRQQNRIPAKAYLARKATIAPQFRHQSPIQALGWILSAKLKGASSWVSFVGQLFRLIYPPAYPWLQKLTNKSSSS